MNWRRALPPVLCALLGGAFGVIGADFLFVGSGLSLLPWAVAALIVGRLSPTRHSAAARAGCYGFALAVVFMLAGFDKQDGLVEALPLFGLLGIIGAGCAALLAVVGHATRRPGSVDPPGWSPRRAVE